MRNAVTKITQLPHDYNNFIWDNLPDYDKRNTPPKHVNDHDCDVYRWNTAHKWMGIGDCTQEAHDTKTIDFYNEAVEAVRYTKIMQKINKLQIQAQNAREKFLNPGIPDNIISPHFNNTMSTNFEKRDFFKNWLNRADIEFAQSVEDLPDNFTAFIDKYISRNISDYTLELYNEAVDRRNHTVSNGKIEVYVYPNAYKYWSKKGKYYADPKRNPPYNMEQCAKLETRQLILSHAMLILGHQSELRQQERDEILHPEKFKHQCEMNYLYAIGGAIGTTQRQYLEDGGYSDDNWSACDSGYKKGMSKLSTPEGANLIADCYQDISTKWNFRQQYQERFRVVDTFDIRILSPKSMPKEIGFCQFSF